MRLFVATMECGDYYCGCGNGHVVGVYTTRERAEEAQKAAEALPLEGSRGVSEAYIGTSEIVEVPDVDEPPLGRKLFA